MKFKDISVVKRFDSIEITGGKFKISVSRELGGFPSSVEFENGKPLFKRDSAVLTAEKSGRRIVPYLKDGFKSTVFGSSEDGCATISIPDISWKHESGPGVPGYRTAVKYDFFEDGVVFVRTFFYAETLEHQDIKNLQLEINPEGIAGLNCEWASWRFPAGGPDAADIQALDCYERFIPAGVSKRWDKEILPFFSFDFGEGERRDNHAEFFVECWNSLAGGHKNTSTEIKWGKKGPLLRWNFQTEKAVKPGRALQWRNTWGWAATRFPEKRSRMPFRAYHYLDNFQRYPDADMISDIAREGADLLVLHENWRLDAKQGEFAYSHSAMKGVSAACRKHGLRLALYVRGNEDGILEDYGASLSAYLRYNYDGIYMDYGGPFHFITCEDENSPAGRMKMRMYYLKMKRVRDFVGPSGVLISHTGAFFSASGQTLCDAYVGGEQEKGRLMESRRAHSYFSGLSVCPSILWTAAFPAYRTKKMLPFLASTAQSPFLHLGSQIHSSSLSHPLAPGSVNYVRALWRLWRLFDDWGPFRVYSDQNSGPGTLGINNRRSGACAFINKKGDLLFVASNFSQKTRTLSFSPDYGELGASGGSVFFLDAGKHPCPCCVSCCPDLFALEAEIGGCCAVGWLITSSPDRWSCKLEEFIEPFPAPSREEVRYGANVARARQKRAEPLSGSKVYLRVWIENFPNTYEDSLWMDLFDNTLELFDLSGKLPVRLGYFSAAGLTEEKPGSSDLIWPGRFSPWVALHKIKGMLGLKKLAVRTRKGKHEFYNFARVEISPGRPSEENTLVIEYCNDIDSDWSSLEFSVMVLPEKD